MNYAKEIAIHLVKADKLLDKALEAGLEKDALAEDVITEYSGLTQNTAAQATSHTRWTIGNYVLAGTIAWYLLHETGADTVVKEKAVRYFKHGKKEAERVVKEIKDAV